MDHVTKLVTIALRRAYQRGARDVDAMILGEVADLMILRRNEITQGDTDFLDNSDSNREAS